MPKKIVTPPKKNNQKAKFKTNLTELNNKANHILFFLFTQQIAKVR